MSLLRALRDVVPPRRLTSTEAYVLAERQAATLLRLRGVHQPPVPTEAIADLPFVTVSRRTPMGSSGAARWIKPRWIILVNGAEPLMRQRFTVSHELKHVLDHGCAERLYGPQDNRSRQQQIERICDYFAGCLLVPRPWLKRAFYGGIQDLTELAELFDVSQPAMQVRLLQVGLVDPYQRCSQMDNTYLRSLPRLPLGLAA